MLLLEMRWFREAQQVLVSIMEIKNVINGRRRGPFALLEQPRYYQRAEDVHNLHGA